VNICRSRRRDFASVAVFDRHRTGLHAYTLLEGLDIPDLQVAMERFGGSVAANPVGDDDRSTLPAARLSSRCPPVSSEREEQRDARDQC
jgi:hypothetical protein